MFAWFSIANSSAAEQADMEQAKRLFDRYVSLESAFDAGVADLYADSAFIKNTRRYPDGQARTMSMPALTYKTLIRQGMSRAREMGDSSTYSDVKMKLEGERVRIDATRYSNLKQYSSPLSLLVGPDASGNWLIYEEISESRP
jgi:hypothetical protein